MFNVYSRAPLADPLLLISTLTFSRVSHVQRRGYTPLPLLRWCNLLRCAASVCDSSVEMVLKNLYNAISWLLVPLVADIGLH